MNTRFKLTFKALYLLFTCTFLAGVTPPTAFAESGPLLRQIERLEKEYKGISSRFYKDSSSYSEESLETIVDIDQLHNAVINLMANKDSIGAIQLLFFNINTLNDNLDDKAVFTFTELLLENNEWKLANKLYKGIQEEGDKSLLATIQFIFAKYHSKRNEWAKVNKQLEGIFSELSPENAAYAYLLNGSALQHLKLHRRAVNNYNKIPANSRYYTYSKLNTAIANIRQGWWTDAQTTINKLIKQTKITNTDELANRLYLVLGYALLQREYYRDARNAFRHIGLNSRYTNRALLGIGLTATSQGDFVGGLNALSILKDKKTFDLSVDESYLLVPYVYEKLQQEITVTASYTEAMSYYQDRIKKLQNMSKRHTDFSSSSYDETSASLIIENNSMEYGKHYPESFLHNYRQLIQFSDITQNKKIKKSVNQLLKKHDKVFQKIVSKLTATRVEFLKSYLNQSRYGLARLYDSTNEARE